MKRAHQEAAAPAPAPAPGSSGMAKSKFDGGDDEMLAELGYKVRSSSMADVAQKMERLEMAMAIGGVGGIAVGLDDFGGSGSGSGSGSVLTQLASETVHYNPSDLNSWLESMLSELNVPAPPPPPPPPPPRPKSSESNCAVVTTTTTTTTTNLDFSGSMSMSGGNSDDLSAVVSPTSREKKRMKSTASTSSAAPLPVVMVEESQEAGVRLVHALVACADAVQQDNRRLAETLVSQIGLLTASQGGAMRKVATYFAEALARRIYQIYPSASPESPSAAAAAAETDLLEMHFYEACPYLKFAHFTANQAILEAFAGKTRVHVIDFGMKQGMQWPALMQALALRPGGAPFFRLTGIGPPQPNNSDNLQEVGWKLAQFADSVHVEFEYRGFVANSLADIEPYMFDVSDTDAVAINSILELHRLLSKPGDIGKVIRTVKSLKPTILTVVEQEANHNGPVFLDRFTEALHYYCSMFDSLHVGNCTKTNNNDDNDNDVVHDEDIAMAEVYLGRQICNVVACEGAERVERHETAEQWRKRIADAGLEMVPLGSNAFKQASLLLELFAGADGYRVEEKDGCLMLGWHTRPLITTSAWRFPAGRILPPDRYHGSISTVDSVLLIGDDGTGVGPEWVRPWGGLTEPCFDGVESNRVCVGPFDTGVGAYVDKCHDRTKVSRCRVGSMWA